MSARMTCTACGAVAHATAAGVARTCGHDAPVAAWCEATMRGAGDAMVERRGPLGALRAALIAVAMRVRATKGRAV
jgi:hypothetical protein